MSNKTIPLKTGNKIFTYHLVFLIFLIFSLNLSDKCYAKGENVKKPSTEVCEHVVSHANRGELNKILIPSEPWDSSKIKEPQNLPGFSAIIFKKLMDINNDGVLERVFVESQGTAHYEEFSVYELEEDREIKLKTSPEDNWESDNLRWAADRAFIEFRGVTYVLGKTDQSLNYLTYINPQNEMKVICEFGQSKEPIQRLKTSRDKKICEHDVVEYNVNFTKLHSITPQVLFNAGFRETSHSREAALIDINNDGKKEFVISLNLSSGAGRGCESTFLGVLTADRSDIDKKITEKLPKGGCKRAKVVPFVVDGKTYLDVTEEGFHAEHRQIYILEKEQLDTVCEFEVRPYNYVLSPVQRIEKAAEHQNPWEYAISQPGMEAVKTLIQGGRDVNESVDKYGNRPLHLAVDQQRDDVLELLLKSGANPNVKNKIMSPLHDAIWRGTDKAVELLLKYGAKAVKDKSGGYNALHEAIWSGSKEKLELLLRYKTMITDEAAVEVVNGNVKDKHEKLKLLIRYGLDVNKKYIDHVVIGDIKKSFGIRLIEEKTTTKTLLEWARESGDPETVKILIEAGAKVPDKSLLQKLKEADTDLNQNYKLLTSSLNEADRKKLQAEQKVWIRERDSKCGSFYKGKSIEGWLRNAAANDNRGLCVLEATKKRTTELSLRLLNEVVPPNEKIEGRSQAEWIQEYWKWSKSFPKDHKPSDDTTSIRCSENQSGAVWFLTGSSSGSPVVRNCEIPSCRYIFLPVLASLAETKDQEQCNRMLTMLDVMTTDIADLHVEVNGKSIPNFTFWRQTTGCFTLQTKEGITSAASDGYWLMLRPFKSGNHMISFRGRFLTGGFSQNVKYNLTVK